MNQYISDVLDTIDSIDAITTEMDLSTSCAMLGAYSKAALILEHHNGEDVSEFSIFKEAEELPEEIKKYNDEHHFARKKADGTDENMFWRIISFVPRIFTFLVKKIVGLFKKDGSDAAQMKANAEAAAKDNEAGGILTQLLNLDPANVNSGTIAKILSIATGVVGGAVVAKLKNLIAVRFKYGLSIEEGSKPFKVKSKFSYDKLIGLIDNDIFGSSGITQHIIDNVNADLTEQDIENLIKKCDEFAKKVNEFVNKKDGSEETLGTAVDIADKFVKVRDQIKDRPKMLTEAQNKVAESIKAMKKKADESKEEKKKLPKNIDKLSGAVDKVMKSIDKLFASFKEFNSAIDDMMFIVNFKNKVLRKDTDSSYRERMRAAVGKNKKTIVAAGKLADEIVELAKAHDTTDSEGKTIDNTKAVMGEDGKGGKARELGSKRAAIEKSFNEAEDNSSKKRTLEIMLRDIDEIIKDVTENTEVTDKFSDIGTVINGTPPTPEDKEEAESDAQTGEGSDANSTPPANNNSTPPANNNSTPPANNNSTPPANNNSTPPANNNSTSDEDILNSGYSEGERTRYYIPDTPYYRNYW